VVPAHTRKTYGVGVQLHSFLNRRYAEVSDPTPAVKNPGTIQQETEWDPDPVRTFQRREKSLHPVRIRTPDRTACSPVYILLWQCNLSHVKLKRRNKDDRENKRRIFCVVSAETVGNTTLLGAAP
jgi:hypothetical protein